jgi:hypothetical protein
MSNFGKVREFSYTTRALQPMTLVVPFEDTVVVQHQLHPFP